MSPVLRHTILKIKTSRREIFVQIFLIFVLPIFLILTKIVSAKAHVLLLVLLVTLLVLVLHTEKWTPKMLGIDWKLPLKQILAYTAFTLFGILIIVQLSERVVGNEELANFWQHSHFLYMFFVVSFFQEVAYRGYLIPALGKLASKPIYIVVANTLLFTFLHTIFPAMLVGLPLAFVGGLGFSLIYMKYPNLPLIILAHSVLNFFAVLYGFYVIPGITY